ncbi:hypothetical protein [Streptomyces roseochromogenus]|uniref:Uncharacterized protein n=1 Tax=Streptomyces roseochromogenus subsp. oscitans DS 12.976 TaxID=1352936 RepID=V6L699_STRRC|nr:hypothetical protein [Streptomyces roseochromogenus]EST36729.1 hypothetical protein M878_00370 [Streptomyces roseochromogenus subsp. oscitans DS 12.976]
MVPGRRLPLPLYAWDTEHYREEAAAVAPAATRETTRERPVGDWGDVSFRGVTPLPAAA